MIFTLGYEEGELFRVGDRIGTVPEFLVYETSLQARYRALLGDGVFDIRDSEGRSVSDEIQDTALAELSQIKAMVSFAGSAGIMLDAEDRSRVTEASKLYIAELGIDGMLALCVTDAEIEQMYEEYALAHKIYDEVTASINPEISDDEARTVTVEQIFVARDSTDDSAARIRIADAYEQVTDTGADRADFADAAARYSDDSHTVAYISAGEADPAIERVVFDLAEGEISPVLETADGYWIFLCDSTIDRTQTDAAKVRIAAGRRTEAFGERYDSYAAALPRRFNQKLWEQTAPFEATLSYADFFKCYDTAFAEKL